MSNAGGSTRNCSQAPAGRPSRRRFSMTSEDARARKREYNRAYYAANRKKILEQLQESRSRSKIATDDARPRRMPQTPEQRREYHRKYQPAWRALNRDKIRRQERARRAKNPGRDMHGRWIKEDRAAMWEAQDGRCYLCGDEMSASEKIDIDHDHSCCPQNRSCWTCRRGLAHHRCNVLIGYAGDDPALLRRIASALEAAQIAFKQRQRGQWHQEQLSLSD